MQIEHGRPCRGEVSIGTAGVVGVALHTEEMEGPRKGSGFKRSKSGKKHEKLPYGCGSKIPGTLKTYL